MNEGVLGHTLIHFFCLKMTKNAIYPLPKSNIYYLTI